MWRASTGGLFASTSGRGFAQYGPSRIWRGGSPTSSSKWRLRRVRSTRAIEAEEGGSTGWLVGIGALLAILVGLLSLPDLDAILGNTWDAALTLIALVILSESLDGNGFFRNHARRGHRPQAHAVRLPGDAAVAGHPAPPRDRDLVGRYLRESWWVTLLA